LVELQLHRSPAGEIDTEVRRPPADLNERYNSQYHHDTGKEKGPTALPHEIDAGFSKNL
jgi:hypothetical protein